MTTITLERSKEFAVAHLLALAEEFEGMRDSAQAPTKQAYAFAAIRCRDEAYRIGGTHFWGRRIAQ